MYLSKVKTVFVLLTNKCINSCSHCKTNSSPDKQGLISEFELRTFLRKLRYFPELKYIIFTGGEPFLFYPLLKVAIFDAQKLGYKTGIETSGYWIQSSKDIPTYMNPLIEAGLNIFILSIDQFHLNTELIKLKQPLEEYFKNKNVDFVISSFKEKKREKPPVSALNGKISFNGDINYFGRASDNLTDSQNKWKAEDFTVCPHLDFEDPGYLYLDFEGNLSVCPGIAIHNMAKTSTKDFVKRYDPDKHPIIKPLKNGGPFLLAQEHNLTELTESGFVDQCHMCYETRKKLLAQYPYILVSREFYE